MFVCMFVLSRIGQMNPPLRPVMKAMDNPKVHCLFAANCRGTAVHRHTKEGLRPMKSGIRRGVLTVDNKKVDQAEYAHSVRTTIGPWMQETGSKLVMADCVTVNRAPEVIDAFKNLESKRFHRMAKGITCPVGRRYTRTRPTTRMVQCLEHFRTIWPNECATSTVWPHTHALLSCTMKSPNSGAPQSIAAWL